MAIQIKDLFGWKKSGRHDLSKVGIAENTRILGRQKPLSVLSPYDVADGADDCEPAGYISRAASTLLLRRAQMLQ